MSFRHLSCYVLSVACVLSGAPRAALAGDGDGDGDIDPSYAQASFTPGWIRLFAGTQDETGVAAARNADGSLIVCLSVPGGTDGAQIGLFKIDADGNRVLAFGDNGEVLKDAALNKVTDMTIDAQGRIVVVGATPGPGGRENFGVVRFNPDGSDDTSFAGDGGVSVGFDVTIGPITTYYQDRAMSVTTDPDGKIVVAGSVFSAGGSDARWGVIRLNNDGSVDQRVAGRYAQDKRAVGNKILRLSHGYYLVVGSSVYAANDSDFGARILQPSLDVASDYSDAGTFAFDVDPGDGSLRDYGSDAALVGADKVVLAGVASGAIAASRIIVVADGGGNPASLALDTGFVGGGLPNYDYEYVSPIQSTDADSNYGTARTRVAVRSDGSVLLGGRFHNTSNNTWSGMLTRLHADGSEDTDFAPLVARFYRAPTSAGTDSSDTGFDDVLVDGGGRPVLVGTSLDSTGDTDGIVARLQSDLIFADGFRGSP